MEDKKVSEYTEKLNQLGIESSILEHPYAKEASHVLGSLGLMFSDSLPTLIMRADEHFIAVVFRGDFKVDFKKIKKELKIKDLRMATAGEFVSLTGLPVGAARVYNSDVATIIDKNVFEKEYLVGGSGSFSCSVKYKTGDLKKIPNNKIMNISQSSEGTARKRVFSGIRATGRLHLGNYFGAVKGMLALQDSYDCVFSVVDLHTITTPYDPSALRSSVREIVLDYLGAGLDPEKCHLEIQSKVPQHTELAYLLSTIYPVSRLEDLPTYKDKKAQFPKYVNMGLLYYPVLMAADILLFKGELVPVGDDQEPHLEVTREIARKFNSMFGEVFPETQRFKTEGHYVPSLTGGGKMSKSVEGSFIVLTDSLETIKERLARVPTDSGTVGGEVPKEGGVATLFSLLKLFKQDDLFNKFTQDYKEKKIRYSEMKSQIAEVIYKELESFRQKRKEYEENPTLVDSIIKKGISECTQMAEETMKEVREKMGLL